jgi:hypothetical protein
MSTVSPALVTQRGARRLPRVPLLLLCAAWVLPGLFGRDPWRNADVAAFGPMVAMAEGRTSWWAPTLGGLPIDAAWLPHALGATFIQLLSPWVDAAQAARVPFGLLLALTLALVWYSTFHLARTEAAQPVAMAFGGEAEPVDYARAVADGALLALLATLGVLQLGHETTPELLQLFALALFLYGLAAAPFRRWQPRAAVLAALPLLAAAGAPSMAVAAGMAGAAVCAFSRIDEARRFAAWVLAATAAAGLLATAAGLWRWRLEAWGPGDLTGIARQWLWFMWPAWLLALWTLWRWRRQLSYRHISVPLVGVVVALAANLSMAGSDRALMLALPGLAVLAAFALPTLKRSASAAVDWFSMFFFTAWALLFWVHYVAMQTGVPPRPAANIARLAPGFEPSFSPLALAIAIAGTVAWMALVVWRTGRHREALWKSLVLPAGGVTLCWLLAMTLLLPPLDYLRSPRALVERIAVHVPRGACVWAPGAPAAAVAALEHFGRWQVVAAADASAAAGCQHWLRAARQRPLPPVPEGWELLAEVQRPADRNEVTQVMRRSGAAAVVRAPTTPSRP